MRETFEDHGQWRWVISCDCVVGGKISTTWYNGQGLVHGFTITIEKAPQSLWNDLGPKAGPGNWLVDAKRNDVFFDKRKAEKELFMRKLKGIAD